METVINEVQVSSEEQLKVLDKQRRLAQPYPPLQVKFASLSLAKTNQEDHSIREKLSGDIQLIFQIFNFKYLIFRPP